VIESAIRVGMKKCKAFSLRNYHTLIRAAKREALQEKLEALGSHDFYGRDVKGMYYHHFGEREYASNFGAEIVRDIVLEDGSTHPPGFERERFFEIEIDDGKRFLVPATRFESCAWVNLHVHSRAYIMAGQATKQH